MMTLRKDHLKQLPVGFTPQIGRAPETQIVSEWLLDPTIRMFAIVGKGGIGKTNFVLNVVMNIRQNLPYQTFFLPLTHSVDANAFASLLGDLLGVALPHFEALHAHLNRFIDTPTCLIIDAAELLSDINIITSLLELNPHLKIILTSRIIPPLSYARTFQLQPLTLPDLQKLRHLSDNRDRIALQSQSIQFFVQVAESLQPTFQFNSDNALVVAEICIALDGIPLAIHLAARQLNTLTLSELAVRLNLREAAKLLTVLAADHRDTPLVQRSLRQSIERSYELLPERQRDLWMQLSVFESGVSLNHLESMEVNNTPVTLGDIRILVSHHVIEPSPHPTQDKPLRFTMTKLERVYAQERLAQEHKMVTARHWHAQHYVSWLAQIAPMLTGPDQTKLFNQIEIEYAEIEQAALAMSTQSHIVESLKLTSILTTFWRRRSYLTEGRALLEKILTQVELATSHRNGTVEIDDFTEFRLLHGESAFGAGVLARFQANYQLADAYCRQAQHIFEALNLQEHVLLVIGERMRIASFEGRYHDANLLLGHGTALAHHLSDARIGVEFVFAKAHYALLRGDLETAQHLLQHCLETYQQLDDVYNIAYTISSLGVVACEREEYSLARQLFTEGNALMPDVHHRRSVWINANIGELVFHQREIEFADNLYQEAIINGLKLGEYWYIAICLEALARSAVVAENHQRAARLLGAADAIRQRYHASRPAFRQQAHQDIIRQLRNKLDEKHFKSSWAYGHQMAFINMLTAIELEDPAVPHSDPTGSHLYRPGVKHQVLTLREQDVMQLLTSGLTDGEIGLKLSISPRTVNAHLRSIYAKLEVNTRTAAVAIALKQGLV
jgi:predicted ATPase/DNA-binding CsgD family transcriptional regulator/tetratricopeptide (TPR) repeat protein